MNWQVIKNRFYWFIRKTILYGLFILIVSFIVGFVLLQFPAVQTAITSRMLRNFNQVTGFEVSYDKFFLSWFDRLEIEGLRVIDPQKNVMIEAERLQINFQLSTLRKNSDLNFDGATLRGAQVNLVTIPETDSTKNLNIDLFIAGINKQFASSEGGGRSPKVNIGEIVLDQSAFSYNNTDKDSIHRGFDYNHFRLGVTDGAMENFSVIGDTIQMRIRSLVAVDQKTKLGIHEFRTFFLYCRTGMEFLDMDLRVGKSIIRDSVIFTFQDPSSFDHFNSKVNVKARLKETVIDPSDLSLFAPGAEKLGQPLHLTGRIDGKVDHFSYRDMNVEVGTTQLAGQLELDGLPTIDETFINLNLKKSNVNINDLQFLFTDDVFHRLRPLGSFRVNGRFVGFINDFVANGDFATRLGRIKTDINLKIEEGKIEQSTYQGNLQLDNFDIGTYFEDTIKYQKVSLSGRVKGSGLTLETANFLLDGTVSSIGILRYNYTNITTNARFAKQLFNGKLDIRDPNLKLNADGSIDFRKGHQVVNIKAKLDTAWLQALKLTRQKVFISSYVDIDSRGLEIDSLFGDAFLKNVTFVYQDDTLKLDTIHVNSSSNGGYRKLALESSLVNAYLEGDYYYSTLFEDLSILFQEFYLNLRNDKNAIAEHYEKKNQRTQEYRADFQVLLRNVEPIANLFDIDLKLSRNITLEGQFNNGYTSIIRAHSSIDSILYNGKVFLYTEIDLDASKVRDSTEVLAAATITSSSQELSSAFKTRDLLIEGIWNGRHVDLEVDFDQVGFNNLVRLKSEIDFLRDSTMIRILPSRIKALEKEWVFNEDNYALVKGKEWQIHQLRISHDNESILLDGRISAQKDPSLKLTVSDLNLDVLNNLSKEKFLGTMNGSVTLRDAYVNPYIQNDISIKDFTVNELLIGDITGTNAWNQQDKRFDIRFYIDRQERRILNIAGFYNPNEKNDPLQVTATMENIQLKVLEPFLRGIFSQIGGTLTGEYSITGTFAAPRIQGEGKIVDGQIMIDYLKTSYSFNGTLGMAPSQIIFKDIVLLDAFNNKATLNGYLAHREFRGMRINIDATYRNFQILNTGARDNSMFYGQGYATGSLNIFGPLSNMKITATARSQKNTKIYIPVNGTESVEKQDFINFTNFTDSSAMNAAKTKAKEKVELTGITMDLNLDITPDAFAEIIFDIKAGDIIRGRGNGNIRLQLDTKGEFNMFGSIEFTEGAYNFTLYDIINKEFSINRGSRIAWYGDPYEANLNITASYKQTTSFAPILADQTVANDPNMRRKYPVDVLLKLDGPMLSPAISFDIEAPSLPSSVPLTTADKPPVQLRFEFTTFKAKLDEQELKKQVFSLIMLRRFSPYGESMSASGSLASSVSELFSNQLSYWLSQVDQNLEIDMDLKGMNQEAFNTFQLRLSYSFLNGRLRVTRDGSFNNQNNRNDISSIAGDWTVDYFLTPDGKFKVKMYSRSNVSSLNNSLGTQTALTTGVSLMHTQNFNQVKDLLRSARNRKSEEEEKKEEQEVEPNDEGGK